MIFHKDEKERSRIVLTGRKNGHEIMPQRKTEKKITAKKKGLPVKEIYQYEKVQIYFNKVS